MIVSEYIVLNNIRSKLNQEKQDALTMLISSPVENTHQITHFKAVYRFIEGFLVDLEEYAKKLNDPYMEEEDLENYFTGKD